VFVIRMSGMIPTDAVLHLWSLRVPRQKSLALIFWHRYDNVALLAIGDPKMGGIAKW
jgi:hypothetical protein